jgi:acyl-CoA thioester hydrolase
MNNHISDINYEGPFRFTTDVRVRWSECDRQGIVFNGAYLEYLEIALSEYFRNLGYSIYALSETDYFDTVVAKAELTFLNPAKVDDILQLSARISRLGNTSINFKVIITRGDNEETISTIDAVYVGYSVKTFEKMSIPEDIRVLVSTYENTGNIISLVQLPNLHEALSKISN